MNLRFPLIYSILFALTFSLAFVSCKDKEKPTPQPPVKVKILEVMPSGLSETREFSGTVSSASTTNVSFAVAGTITNLYVEEGQKVSKGQLLGKVRSGDYENAYNIAMAELAEAQDGYDRLKKLHDANALPEVKWVEIQQKLKQARNAAEISQRALDDASLHSPASGTVTWKFADVGQTVVPVEPVYEIVSTDNLTIDINVGENEIGSFSQGQKAQVYLETTGTEPIEGKVSQRAVVADPLTRSYTVKISIPNKEGKILPGMIGDVKFESITGQKPSETPEITLPSGAILLNNDNRWFVWIANDSVAERRFITTGRPVAGGVTVESGLNAGDKVIVEGMQKVGTGTRLNY